MALTNGTREFPWRVLVPALRETTHVEPAGGRRAGTGRLNPATTRGTGDRSLAVLLEDRGRR